VFKPPVGDGGRDLFIFDYLGMLGIPCVPTTHLDPAMRSVFVPAHGVGQPDTHARIREILEAGGTVILTFDALARMADEPEVLGLFGYDAAGVAPGVVVVEGFEVGQDAVESAQPIRLAGDLAPADADVLAWGRLEACEYGTMRIPVATAKAHAGGGKALVWNIGTFGHDAFQVSERLNVPQPTDLFALPKPVIDLLRATATDPLGFTIDALPRVACFVFARHLVLVNYTSGRREVHTRGLHPLAETLLADSTTTVCTGDDFFLAPHSFAAVEIRPET